MTLADESTARGARAPQKAKAAGLSLGRPVWWTAQRDAMLRDLWPTGACSKTIARALGDKVSPGAVRMRASLLGLTGCPVRAAAVKNVRAELRAARKRLERKAATQRAVARAERNAAKRLAIWNLVAAGEPVSAICKAVGVDPKRAAAFLAQGRPPGAPAHLVTLEHFDAAMRPRAKRLGIPDMLNAVGESWRVPPTALFGRNSQESLRVRQVSNARAEAGARLRICCGLSLLVCEALLRVGHASVIHGIKRIETRPEFAFLRAEMGGRK